MRTGRFLHVAISVVSAAGLAAGLAVLPAAAAAARSSSGGVHAGARFVAASHVSRSARLRPGAASRVARHAVNLGNAGTCVSGGRLPGRQGTGKAASGTCARVGARLAQAAAAAGSGSLFTPVSPVRLMDTRNGTGGVTGPVGAGATVSLQVAGKGGVPASGVTAVVVNVTATSPTAASYVSVYPDGTARPAASNLDFAAAQTIANLVVVPVGADGKIDFYNAAGTVQLIADLSGYYTAGSGSLFTPVSPVRLMDTRNGTGGVTGPVGAGATVSLQVAGKGGVPASGVTAVVVNVTATSPTAASYVSVYPDGTARPAASNLDFAAAQTIANLVVVPVGADGKIDFYNAAGTVQLIADLSGYYTAGSGSLFTPVSPVRMMDTRNGTGGVTGPVGAGATVSLPVAGKNGVPAAGVTAVVLNVTATSPTAASYVSVYPDGTTRPAASNLGFTAAQTIANLVVVPVGADGKIDFYNSGGTVQLIADLSGYYTAGSGSLLTPVSPVRLMDTRN